MDLHFYLNGQEVKLSANSSITEILDETRDSGTAVLEYNSSPNQILPMTPFKIVDNDSGDVIPFYVISDAVEKVSKTKALYSHTITFTEKIAQLDLQTMRNSVFSRRINEDKVKAYCNVTGVMVVENDTANSRLVLKDDGLRISCTNDGNRNLSFSPYFQIPKRFSNSFRFKLKGLRFRFDTLTGTSYSSAHQYSEKNIVKSATFYIEKYRYDPSDDSFTYVDRVYLPFGDDQSPTAIDSDNVKPLNNNYQSIFENADEYDYFRIVPINSKRGITLTTPSVFPPYSNYSSTSTDIYCFMANVRLEMEINGGSYTLYDILRELRLQALKTYNNANSVDPSKLFELPESNDDYYILSRTIAPTFSFTGKNLYECVAEIFNYLDAVPTMDDNRVLHIEYFNDYNRSKITPKFNEKNAIISLEGYTNRIVSEYQNGRKENAIDYPAKNLFRKVASQTYGVVGRDDYIMPVQQPIDYVDKVQMKLSGGTATILNMNILNENGTQVYQYDFYQFPLYRERIDNQTVAGIIDITQAIFEEKQYNLLPYQNADDGFPNRYNTFYYSQGSKFIYMGEMVDLSGTGYTGDIFRALLKAVTTNDIGLIEFGYSTVDGNLVFSYLYRNLPSIQTYSNKWEIEYNIQYHGMLDGKLAIENREQKYDGDTLVAQTAGQPQMNRMGTNMEGLLHKIGNARYTCSMELTSFDQRIKKGQIWLDSNGNKYIANSIKTTFSTSSSKVYTEIEFVKNFNELSLFTKLDNSKRFYEIDQSLISKGYEIITEFMYFSTEDGDISESVTIDNELVGTIFLDTILGNARGNEPSFAMIRTKTNGNGNNVGKYSNIGSTEYTACPVNSYGAGNMICYEVGFDDAISAGDMLISRTGVLTTVTSQPILYTDPDGYADQISIRMGTIGAVSDDLPYYPLVDNTPSNYRVLIYISDLNYRKRPNEIFRLNFEIACLPYGNEEIFFGDAFIANNAGVSNTEWNGLTVWISDSYEYSIIDKIAQGTKLNGATVSESHSIQNGLDINLGSTQTVKSWCLADDNGNIYIAGNFKNATSTDEFNLYAFVSRNRLQNS